MLPAISFYRVLRSAKKFLIIEHYSSSVPTPIIYNRLRNISNFLAISNYSYSRFENYIFSLYEVVSDYTYDPLVHSFIVGIRDLCGFHYYIFNYMNNLFNLKYLGNVRTKFISTKNAQSLQKYFLWC